MTTDAQDWLAAARGPRACLIKSFLWHNAAKMTFGETTWIKADAMQCASPPGWR